MRRLAVVVALAGCGRLGFASDAAIDAADAMPPPGSIVFVQHANSMCASVTTCSQSFMQLVQHGDGIVVTATYDDPSVDVTAVTDTSGNVYRPAVAGMSWPVSPYRTSAWFATHAGATGVVGVTVHLSAASATFAFVYVDEYANATAVADMASAVGNGNTLAPSTGFRTVATGELIFGHAEGQGPTVGGGLNFALRDTSNMNIEEDRLVTVDGSYDAHFTLDNPGEWIALMVVLR